MLEGECLLCGSRTILTRDLDGNEYRECVNSECKFKIGIAGPDDWGGGCLVDPENSPLQRLAMPHSDPRLN